jgi:uncharacterized metal-binding protein YceD (DUF177 family)
MLKLNLDSFLKYPGKHFPIDLLLEIEEAASLSDDFSFLEALEVTGEAFFQLNTLYFVIQIHTVVEQPCRRCLAPVHTPVECYEHFSVSLPDGEDSIDLTAEVVGLISASIDPRPSTLLLGLPRPLSTLRGQPERGSRSCLPNGGGRSS